MAPPGPYARTFFEFWKKKFFSWFLRIFFVFVNMGANGSENFKTRYSSYKSQPKVFKLFLNFLPNGPHKTTFGIFENWNFNEFYSFSLTWDPMGAKISKRYSSYKPQPNVLKLALNFPPNGPHIITFGIFEILSVWFLTNFVENSKFTIVAYGEIKKTIIWKTSDRRAKRSEISDSWVVI